MRILFISAVLPYPLYSGGQIRIYNLLKEATRHHDITLCAFTRSIKEDEYKKQLKFCKTINTALRGPAWQVGYITRAVFGIYPFVFSTYNLPQMRSLIQQELSGDSYDLIHIEPGYVFPALPQTSLPLVVAEHNIEHVVYEGYVRRFPIVPLRPLLFADVLKLRVWERTVWKRADRIITVSASDAAVISTASGAEKVTVVPNGVDTSAFPLAPKKAIIRSKPVFLFVGNFSWMQNRDAVLVLVERVWRQLQLAYKGAQLRIVGKNMSGSLKRKIQREGVILLEHVEDIRTEYRRADVLLAPITIGGGTKFKILEAMASGLPVVTTTKGAEGLHVEDGKHLLIADNFNDILPTVERALDRKTREPLIAAARQKIEAEYAWSSIADKLLAAWRVAHEQNH